MQMLVLFHAVGALSVPPSVPPVRSTDFILNKGLCVDALRTDATCFYDRELHWEIYDEAVLVRDPAGFGVRGLDAYKRALWAVRLFRRLMLRDAAVTRSSVRDDDNKLVVQWYSCVQLRMLNQAHYVDGLSTFYLDDQGKVYRHTIDKLVVDGRRCSNTFELPVLARFRASQPCCYRRFLVR